MRAGNLLYQRFTAPGWFKYKQVVIQLRLLRLKKRDRQPIFFQVSSCCMDDSAPYKEYFYIVKQKSMIMKLGTYITIQGFRLQRKFFLLMSVLFSKYSLCIETIDCCIQKESRLNEMRFFDSKILFMIYAYQVKKKKKRY